MEIIYAVSHKLGLFGDSLGIKDSVPSNNNHYVFKVLVLIYQLKSIVVTYFVTGLVLRTGKDCRREFVKLHLASEMLLEKFTSGLKNRKRRM